MKVLALGTAQFGIDYGIANEAGKVSHAEGNKIIECARAVGINTIDTAIAYGESERQLGILDVRGLKVVTKLPGLSADVKSIAKWADDTVHDSLKKLRLSKLYGVLLHSAGDLLQSYGEELYAVLQDLREAGLVKKFGISSYSVEETDAIISRYPMDLVQFPLNLLDRRLVDSGLLSRLQRMGVEVHTRSAFLQGLLLMSPASRPNYFNRWRPIWDRWDQWLAASGVSPVAACLGYALSVPAIDRIIVGVENLAQLEEILEAAAAPVPVPPAELRSNDPDLINPSRWQLS